MLRTFFVRLSENPFLRNFAERSSLGRRVSGRFVAGTEIADAVRATQAINRAGMSVTIDNLGENVTNPDEARHSARLYHEILDAIVAHQINAKIVGAVIQAYLKRSEGDIEKLLAEGIRIRLCKGAYKEPPEIAFPAKSDVDANYVKLMKILMKSGIYHGLATHDENIIQQAKAFATSEKISCDSFEFQMLYGIRRDLQRKLVRAGWRLRIYIPFGTEWYPYFMRRLGERPANVLFIARNLLRS